MLEVILGGNQTNYSASELLGLNISNPASLSDGAVFESLVLDMQSIINETSDGLEEVESGQVMSLLGVPTGQSLSHENVGELHHVGLTCAPAHPQIALVQEELEEGNVLLKKPIKGSLLSSISSFEPNNSRSILGLTESHLNRAYQENPLKMTIGTVPTQQFKLSEQLHSQSPVSSQFKPHNVLVESNDLTKSTMVSSSLQEFSIKVQPQVVGRVFSQKANIAPREFAVDVASKLGVMIKSTNKESVATLRLDPPELGRIEVKVRTDGERSSVTLNSQQAVTRELVGASIERLRAELVSSGLDVSVSHGSLSQDTKKDEDRHEISEQAVIKTASGDLAKIADDDGDYLARI
ncbi:flagellar hook-length control protein FliK [Vibrio barjaei]|uniref:flagellar hook-length control protein FliK n=1 Tax=Vibrio barjaei TaxID=1676683 RepID=UPI00228389B4|nr:flagellar hook-length control protein FliK [Vibrio barjaei]MCY9872296.1 flagellar hook-length control protein FliK [Vibrio barjaei]